MAKDSKEWWLRVALVVAEETLALLRAPASVFLASPRDAKAGPDDSAGQGKGTPAPSAGDLHTLGSYVVSIPPKQSQEGYPHFFWRNLNPI